MVLGSCWDRIIIFFFFIDIIDGDGICASIMPNRDVFIVLEENVE